MLTHWGRDKMAAIFPTTFSTTFSWMKKFELLTIDNIPALVLIMAWRRPGDKPLSEPMLVRSPTHTCVTRPQWVNTLRPRQNVRHFLKAISNAFLLINIFLFRWKFHRILFIRVQLTTFQHCFRYWLCAEQATSHCLNQWWLDYRRIYASRGLNQLML